MTPVFLKRDNFPACLLVPNNDHVGVFLKLQNEEETRRYFVRYLPLGRKQEIDWIEKANTTQSDIVFAIGTHPKAEAVGSIGLHRIHWKDRRAELGIGILETHCNKGVGTCASMLMLHYAFNELGLNKVVWRAVGYNDRSIATAKKCGGKEAARHTRHIWRQNAWHDELAFDIHADVWQKVWTAYEKLLLKKAKPAK